MIDLLIDTFNISDSPLSKLEILPFLLDKIKIFSQSWCWFPSESIYRHILTHHSDLSVLSTLHSVSFCSGAALLTFVFLLTSESRSLALLWFMTLLRKLTVNPLCFYHVTTVTDKPQCQKKKTTAMSTLFSIVQAHPSLLLWQPGTLWQKGALSLSDLWGIHFVKVSVASNIHSTVVCRRSGGQLWRQNDRFSWKFPG